MIRAFDFDSAFAEKIDKCAVQNGGAELCFDVIADERQVFIGESL